MCSQPPRDIDDLDFLHNVNLQIITLLTREVKVLGITGGEPTILGERLVNLLRFAYEKLPSTTIHMLSNGRAYSRKDYAEKTANSNPNLQIGIPLYSDNYVEHNYIVQNSEAFDQTITGFHNLERYGQSSELRIVITRINCQRLYKLAKFIYKNLPFVDHIAFMGLEFIGYTPHNKQLLWIEPTEFSDELEDAITFLESVGMHVSIYNLQHCVLKTSLWKFSRKSISDWKQAYTPECDKCKKRDQCCGVFATSKYLSNEIKAIVD
jgi:His-Xaa-Ser system radical SAM maturase HxsC